MAGEQHGGRMGEGTRQNDGERPQQCAGEPEPEQHGELQGDPQAHRLCRRLVSEETSTREQDERQEGQPEEAPSRTATRRPRRRPEEARRMGMYQMPSSRPQQSRTEKSEKHAMRRHNRRTRWRCTPDASHATHVRGPLVRKMWGLRHALAAGPEAGVQGCS